MKSHSQNVVPKVLREALIKNITIEHISGSVVKSFIQFAFVVCQVEVYQNILKPSYRPLTFTSYKAILKDKNRTRTSPPASFSA